MNSGVVPSSATLRSSHDSHFFVNQVAVSYKVFWRLYIEKGNTTRKGVNNEASSLTEKHFCQERCLGHSTMTSHQSKVCQKVVRGESSTKTAKKTNMDVSTR